ncbi:hypothetical protein MHBO_000384 [Bonamia ostreae]|uniref:Uncharacterized protein n=1 Tax=Bonamia ostreae TaxID=126728 RepID=A0ABV2AFH3_9EUKA
MISALRRNHCRSRNTLLSLNAHARDFARRSMLSKAAKKRFVDFSLKSPREKAMALLAPLLLAGTLSFCFYSLLVDDKHIKVSSSTPVLEGGLLQAEEADQGAPAARVGGEPARGEDGSSELGGHAHVRRVQRFDLTLRGRRGGPTRSGRAWTSSC